MTRDGGGDSAQLGTEVAAEKPINPSINTYQYRPRLDNDTRVSSDDYVMMLFSRFSSHPKC